MYVVTIVGDLHALSMMDLNMLDGLLYVVSTLDDLQHVLTM